MKRVIICCFTVLTAGFLFAQDCPNYPADCPETDWIEVSQSRNVRLNDGILPQEVNMQDKMRTLFTGMMENAAKTLHLDMIELKEYTNEGSLQSNTTPYPLRSPRGIDITFQFIANKDSLQAWKDYQSDYDKRHSNDVSQDYSNITTTTESPLYKRYKDSADYYMNLYVTYVDKHKDEGAALYTTDKHPAYYQKKETEFLDKLNALTDQTHENDGIETKEVEHEKITRRFRTNTVVQVHFQVNTFAAEVEDISDRSTSIPLSIKDVKLARLITIGNPNDFVPKWANTILMLLGNFHTTPVEDYKYLYDAGFNHTSQGDEGTPKKIKSDKVQGISIAINGKKEFIEKMAKFIDVDKLNGTIVKL